MIDMGLWRCAAARSYIGWTTRRNPTAAPASHPAGTGPSRSNGRCSKQPILMVRGVRAPHHRVVSARVPGTPRVSPLEAFPRLRELPGEPTCGAPLASPLEHEPELDPVVLGMDAVHEHPALAQMPDSVEQDRQELVVGPAVRVDGALPVVLQRRRAVFAARDLRVDGRGQRGCFVV